MEEKKERFGLVVYQTDVFVVNVQGPYFDRTDRFQKRLFSAELLMI